MMHSLKKRLIVNADDFGLTQGINQGIIDTFKNGIVSRASIIVNTKFFDHALALSRENPSLGLGIHLVLVEEQPISDTRTIKSLVDSKGKLLKNYQQFLYRYFKNQIDFQEISIELEAQIKKALNSGIKLTHLDSHQHLHVLPGICKIVKELMEKYGIKNIRMPSITLKNRFSVKSHALSIFSSQSIKFFKNSEITHPDYVLGIGTSGVLNEQRLVQLVKNCDSGTSEIVCHPGFSDLDFKEHYAHWQYNPEIELEALKSSQIKDLIRQLNIELIPNLGE